MELDFSITSIIIILIPVLFFIWAIKKNKFIKKTAIFLVVHILWLIFWYFELSCQSASCLEWETNSSGSVLILFSMFPLIIIPLFSPWYFGLFKKLKE